MTRLHPTAVTAWILWDAGDRVSLHPTPHEASEARDELLQAHLSDFPDDADLTFPTTPT
jgi:hypothetical protein